MRTNNGHHSSGLPASLVPRLVLQAGVLPQQGSPFLPMEERMAGLAQQHEPVWIQILVVRDELVVHI